MDTPDFPAAWRAVAQAHARALDEIYRPAEDLDWTYVSPAALIEPGERTGRYRTGGDDLLTDGSGESRISIPDFAVALADVVDNEAPLRQRITVAY
jgi:putative NADH-flavin reductase